MNYPARVREIRAELAAMRDEHYQKYNVKKVTKAYQERATRNTDSNYHLKQLCKSLKLKGSDEISQADIDIRKADIFITTDQEPDRVVWSNLENEERVRILKEYLNTPLKKAHPRAPAPSPLNQEVISEILELAADGKLTRKSDIHFDEVNSRIVKINILRYDEEKDQYYLNLQQKKERDIKRKRMNKMLKK